jgi:hypothetical protein
MKCFLGFFSSISASFSLLAHDAVLFDELKRMCEKDQKARFAVIESGDLRSEESAKIVEAIDQENLPRLKAIINRFGWPGFELVGEEGADKMWLLVQHCDRDLEFQKACLQLLEDAVAKEDVPKRHLAYLTDRVLVNEGLPQLYGTQVQIIEGQAILRPIEQADQLDKRRAEMGMEPFDDYLSLLKKAYHLE